MHFPWHQTSFRKTCRRNFAYGTVVQMYLARNRRQRSAQYTRLWHRSQQEELERGLNIVPILIVTAALYRGHDAIQYKNSEDKLILNRDDLDSMVTHNKVGTLEVKGVTARSDYQANYPNKLQTTS